MKSCKTTNSLLTFEKDKHKNVIKDENNKPVISRLLSVSGGIHSFIIAFNIKKNKLSFGQNMLIGDQYKTINEKRKCKN